MPDRIKMLSPETIDQIAAGEVILRPVSVVKELTENAIDAGAKHISIAIEEGGKKKITITDDGCGIRYNELPLAFRRHATSKISFAKDLSEIRSLGFRGEALSSIIAVAEVEMSTRYKDEEIGSRINFQNGKMVSQSVAAWDRGSQIVVSGLFADVPARQKYLKKDDKEERVIRETVECLALSHPEIGFTYENGKRKVFQTPGTGDLLAAASSIFGKSIARSFHPFESDNVPMKITGLIGDLDLRRTHRGFQRFFVNGRYIKSPKLQRAYEEAWEGLLMQHQFPAGIIQIDLPPQYLDINVHPQKTEIRLLNETLTLLLFRQGIRDALRSMKLISMPLESEAEENPESGEAAAEEQPAVEAPVEEQIGLKAVEKIDFAHLDEENLAETEPTEKAEPNIESPVASKPVSSEPEPTLPLSEENVPVSGEPADHVNERPASFEGATDLGAQVIRKETVSPESALEPIPVEDTPTEPESKVDPMERILQAIPPSRHLSRPEFSRLHISGTLFQTYILLEEFGRVFLIDQHAAHEAILYEEFRDHLFKKTGFPSQQRLIPKSVSVSPDEAELFEKYRDEILQFGFEADRMGEDRLAVRAVPVILGEEQDAEMIREIITLFDEKKDPTKGLGRIITMSCKKAVKGGEALSRPEIEKLLTRLEQLDNPYTCPHGRPVILKLNENELRKLFKRIV